MSKSKKSPNKIRKDVLATKISNFLEYGRKEITTKNELENFPIGSLISYINHKGHFKQGGFITKFADDYFIFITPDFTSKFRVRYKNTIRLWAGNVFNVSNDIISFAGTSQKKTNFPVVLNDIIVFYANSNYDAKRFMNTDRYRTLLLWYNYFIVDN